MKETIININGLNVATSQKKGSESEWVVCIHGLQSNKSVFDAMLERPFYKDYSLLAIDCIGFGNSEKPRDFSYDLQTQTDICLSVLDELHIQHCHIIGHSMGGMIGTLLLQPLGTRLASFVNMEGNLVFSDCGKSAEVVKMSLKDFERTGYGLIKKELETSKEPSASYRRQYLEKTPAYVFYKASETIVEWSRSEKLAALFNGATQKRMFMYGAKNAPKANSVGKGVAKSEIADAGHFMMFDNTEATNTAIEKFLS